MAAELQAVEEAELVQEAAELDQLEEELDDDSATEEGDTVGKRTTQRHGHVSV